MSRREEAGTDGGALRLNASILNASYSRPGRAMLQAVVAAFLIITLPSLSGFAQERKALTLDGIIHLIREGSSPTRVSQLIEQYGVAFELDDAALRQLKEAGASEAVLSAVKKMAARYSEEQQRQRREAEARAKAERERQDQEAKARA